MIPTPESLIDTIDKYGFARKMMAWGLATNAVEAVDKAMCVLGIVPMAVIFFATEAIPIGVTGILMPIFAYFLNLLPINMVGKSFAGDAPMFMLGVFALGVSVVEVGFHKRLAIWLLGWTSGFWLPMIVLCISMSTVGSLLSAPAMCSFMTPVLMGEPWAIGLGVAFASSYAHFLVVDSPTNALTYGLGVYPDSEKRVIHTIDFLKYGFGLWILCMLLLWVVCFLGIFQLHGFPDGILETATHVLNSTAR